MLIQGGKPKRVVAITTNRADYSSVRPVVRQALKDPALDMMLLVAGAHVASSSAQVISTIDDSRKAHTLWGPLLSEYASAEISGEWRAAFTNWTHNLMKTLRPDLLVLTGDRSEIVLAANSALCNEVPIAHISGGDITMGSIDNQNRFAVSMMSSLHFVSHESHARRLIQMGEASQHVHVVGDPALDDLPTSPKMSREELFAHLGLVPSEALVMLSYHPPSIDTSQLVPEINALVEVLSDFQGAIVATRANGDRGTDYVNERLDAMASRHPNMVLRSNLGQDLFYEVLHHAAYMIGNSSSGIWEAPSIGLPVINVGNRQTGRIRSANVMDASGEPEAIALLIESALSDEMSQMRGRVVNPYSRVNSAEKIIEILSATELGAGLLRKDFISTPALSHTDGIK